MTLPTRRPVRQLLLVGALGASLLATACSDPENAPSGGDIELSIGTQPTAPTPMAAPTSPAAPTADAHLRELVGGTQARWDPRRVDDLSTVDPDDLLPPLVSPPRSSAPLTSAPIEAAVLAVRGRGTGQLLSTSGEWRSVPLTGRWPALALSPGGTQLLVWQLSEHDGVEIYDLASGESRSLGSPQGFQAWDFSTWVWVDERTVLLDDLRGGWLIDTRTGRSRQVPYPREFAWTADPDGDGVVETTDYDEPATLSDWTAGSERRVPESATGRLLSLQVNDGTVAGTAYDGRPFSVMTADRKTMHPRAVLPLVDHEGFFSNGGLSLLSLRDDGTVLLQVHLMRGRGAFRVVRWDPGAGHLSVISAVDIPAEHSIAFASGLLRTGGRTR